MPVIELADDSEFLNHLGEAGQRLVVVDFFAVWCGPCNAIAPFFKQLSTSNPNVAFIKVDVDKCPGTAAANNVSAMPTFVFFKNRSEIDRLRGADKSQLEAKIKLLAADTAVAKDGETPTTGIDGEFIDLVSLINKTQSECLNQDDDHTYEHALNSSTATYLQSDCDEQLLLHITFMQPIKLNSLIIQGPEDKGPKDVKIFINQIRTLDFDAAESNQPIQTLEIKPEELTNNTLIKLRYVKFQNVQNITLFFANNQSSCEQTVINHLKFIGSTVAVTNMSDFKRVAGQVGEAHG